MNPRNHWGKIRLQSYRMNFQRKEENKSPKFSTYSRQMIAGWAVLTHFLSLHAWATYIFPEMDHLWFPFLCICQWSCSLSLGQMSLEADGWRTSTAWALPLVFPSLLAWSFFTHLLHKISSEVQKSPVLCILLLLSKSCLWPEILELSLLVFCIMLQNLENSVYQEKADF